MLWWNNNQLQGIARDPGHGSRHVRRMMMTANMMRHGTSRRT